MTRLRGRVRRKLIWHRDATPDATPHSPQLDAKVRRCRQQLRQRIEQWKDQLLNQVFERTDPAAHADLINAMLEIAIEWKIAHLGADHAEDLFNLAFRRLARASRGMRENTGRPSSPSA